MKIQNLFTLLLFLVSGFAQSQDDLLDELNAGAPKVKDIEIAAFKGLQICNMQSTKMAAAGEWYFLVSHRFGDLTEGFNNFFGLDYAYSKIGGIYGLTEYLSIGATRHTYRKTYEFGAKYKVANQFVDGFPVTIVGYNTAEYNSELANDAVPQGLTFKNRLAFTTQLLISRKFNESFSLEIAPVYVHKNVYYGLLEQKSMFLLGTAARYKLTKRLSLNLEYAARLNLIDDIVSPYQNPLSLGLDLETGGHVFQFVFSNSQPMNDAAFYTNASGRWDGTKQLYFGFNLYREFK